jgi:hypothetical protein
VGVSESEQCPLCALQIAAIMQPRLVFLIPLGRGIQRHWSSCVVDLWLQGVSPGAEALGSFGDRGHCGFIEGSGKSSHDVDAAFWRSAPVRIAFEFFG